MAGAPELARGNRRWRYTPRVKPLQRRTACDLTQRRTSVTLRLPRPLYAKCVPSPVVPASDTRRPLQFTRSSRRTRPRRSGARRYRTCPSPCTTDENGREQHEYHSKGTDVGRCPTAASWFARLGCSSYRARRGHGVRTRVLEPAGCRWYNEPGSGGCRWSMGGAGCCLTPCDGGFYTRRDTTRADSPRRGRRARPSVRGDT